MPDSLVLWQIASGLFFVYTIAVALSRPWTARRRRAVIIAGAGLVGTGLSAAIPHYSWLHDWVLPPSLLLLGYWSSGALFVAPMPRAEALLMAVDRALGLPIAGAPRLLAECLEAAYASVYPNVGLAFVFYLVFAPLPSPARFWAVVLITDYVCFAMLPWVQTRPPRTLEDQDPWRSSLRTLNLRMLGTTSIHVNTCPSGHAAEAAAVGLLLAGAPLTVVAGMIASALAISAGAVFGRYHYALDVLAGWLVAATVWWLAS
jgi:membrane-associated phospholipid phosphatase